MKKYLVLILVLMAALVIPSTAIDEIISFNAEYTYSVSYSYSLDSDSCVNGMMFAAIENYQHVVQAELFESGVDGLTNSYSDTLYSTFTAKIDSTIIGEGVSIYSPSSDDKHDRCVWYFSSWDISGQTGAKTVLLYYDDASYLPAARDSTGDSLTGWGFKRNNAGRLVSNAVNMITYTSPFAAHIVVSNTNTSGILNVFFDRNVNGTDYGSWFGATTLNYTYYNNVYAANGSYDFLVNDYPLSLRIAFGYPATLYHWNMTFPGSNPDVYYPEQPTETPTETVTPTATPTPGTDLCQYWSLSLNTSNINRNEAVLGTLTETDAEDRFDMIDWYQVLPGGNEYIRKHYVYDPGMFGLGAGWFLVDSYTGYTEASSVDEALENEIDFTTSGGAHYVRVRIYDDKSLLPLVYHDYDHVCTKEAIVYVGETTQSLTQQGINVYEADTNAFLSDVSLSVYDYGSGEWQNKTSSYGSTTYFNAVPGHSMRVLATKAGWLSSDSTFTVANPPVPYAVYLKRPLPDIVNKSYAFFNVRDSVTHTGLYQATIQLSDGQLQSTLPSGYAGFSVNDSESYYYTVSKPGYQTLTSTFSISEDTTIPVLLVQIAPTPTVTLPITTLPTVTVTGTLTPTVTGTTTLTATATGTYSNATLAAAERVQKTTKAADVWYTNAETLSNLLFLAVIVGVLGLMSNAMDKRRRRR